MVLPKTTPLIWQLTIGRGLINTELLPEEQGVCVPQMAPQPLELAPEGKAPKHPTLKTSGAYIQEDQRAVGNKGFTLKGLER